MLKILPFSNFSSPSVILRVPSVIWRWFIELIVSAFAFKVPIPCFLKIPPPFENLNPLPRVASLSLIKTFSPFKVTISVSLKFSKSFAFSLAIISTFSRFKFTLFPFSFLVLLVLIFTLLFGASLKLSLPIKFTSFSNKILSELIVVFLLIVVLLIVNFPFLPSLSPTKTSLL